MRSSATIVLSKVGAAESFAILSTSASCSVIAASSAGLKSAICTLSKGGTPPKGPSHFAVSGLPLASLVGTVVSVEELFEAFVMSIVEMIDKVITVIISKSASLRKVKWSMF